ncbi:hypothetical protein ACWT_2061 [Actinoplanes sp. SE50]|uniref:hypothetical protein n=1 Tax=unclassified Actinoplanes TaxID=2626549 RepID=UPI00023EC5BF|nr:MULTISPECIES: hypothetical protein [unclassified Actinoplanes]AEV83080.1 hypothetical protein ACPL_2183 [Actinoplanes sp. SE50/110]ATO81476.1 hypothetical protein ACWT_2061 [Actinoplanes sp. SE50]SLL98883.1 hypothetical protein ACSP50_2110 [Actinoplanes sp. SE50/110]
MTAPFTQPTAEEFRAATTELRELNAPYARERLIFRPPVESPGQVRRLEAACQTVFEGLDAVLREVCGGDVLRMARLCRATEPELQFLTHQTDQNWSTVARPDVISSGGRTVVVEINGDSPAGLFGLHDIIARAQAAFQRPAPQAPARPAVAMRGLLDSLERSFGRLTGTVAICYWRHEQQAGPLDWQYELFARELRRHGVDAVHCALEDLRMDDAGVAYQGRPVQVIYRYFESPEPTEHDEFTLLKQLFALAGAGLVGLFTGYRAEVLASKAALAVLSDETVVDRLDADLRDRLAAHVPWTRVLEPRRTTVEGADVDLLPWVAANRERLIVKPVRGHAGKGITVGREVSARAWAEAVGAGVRGGAGDHPYIVQQVFEPDRLPVAFTDATGRATVTETPSVNGVFIVDGRAVAVLRRYAVNATGTININPFSGYAPSPVWTAS